MAYPPTKELTSCAAGVGETALVDASWSDDNVSLFPSSDNDVTIDNTCSDTDEVGVVIRKIEMIGGGENSSLRLSLQDYF